MIGQEISLRFEDIPNGDEHQPQVYECVTFSLRTSVHHPEKQAFAIRLGAFKGPAAVDPTFGGECELTPGQARHLRDFLTYALDRRPQ